MTLYAVILTAMICSRYDSQPHKTAVYRAQGVGTAIDSYQLQLAGKGVETVLDTMQWLTDGVA